MNGLIEELKRRNVFRVGIAYVVVSWLIVQVVDTIAGPLSLPDWLAAVVIVLLLVGFPIALLFAWAFELTPEGVKRTADVDVAESVTADTGQKLNFAIIGALALAVAFFAWDRQRLVGEIEEQANEAAVVQAEPKRASIAVLPFVDMSAERDQEYFSDGISEELLNVLAKIPEFRVAARTSSFQFKDTSVDISEVASQLNVGHVLEGSVRKDGETIRITAQLIEADSGFHVWSESYDRKLDDVFAIQDEISGAIVRSLADTLGFAETLQSPESAKITSDENYNAYLLARTLVRQRNEVDLNEARSLLETITANDPDYSPALVQLALTWYLLSDSGMTYGSLPLSETVPIAMDLVERALDLSPEDPEALGVRGLLTMDATGDGEASLEYMRRSLELNPSQSDVRTWYSNSLMFSGNYAEADRQLAIGLEYDPLSMLLLMNYAYRLVGKLEVDSLQPLLDRIERLDPARASSIKSSLAEMQGRMADSVVHLIEALEQAPGESRYRVDLGEQFLKMERAAEARRLLTGPDDGFWLAITDKNYEQAREESRSRMAEVPESFASRYFPRIAHASFLLGDYDTTIDYGRRALSAAPDELRDHLWANVFVASSLIIQGDSDSAAPLLDRYIAATAADIEAEVFAPPSRHFGLATAQMVRGNHEAARQSFAFAAERAAFNSDLMDPLFARLGLDEDDDYRVVVDRADERWNEEQIKLRDTICADGRFETWQPLEETCIDTGLSTIEETTEST